MDEIMNNTYLNAWSAYPSNYTVHFLYRWAHQINQSTDIILLIINILIY